MKTGRNCLVIGGSGLVGSHLIDNLLQQNSQNHIFAFLRRPMGIENSRLHELIVDFDKLSELTLPSHIDDYYCAIGTTMKKAKTKYKFFKIDYEYALAGAELALKHRANRIGLVSTLGANSNSFVYYNRVKGQLEETVKAQAWKKIVLARPSIILGERSEGRWLEDQSKKLLKLINPILKLGFSKYAAVEASEIAKNLIERVESENRKKIEVLYF